MPLTYSKIKNMVPGSTLILNYPDADGKSVPHAAALLDTGDWGIYNKSGVHLDTVSAGIVVAYDPAVGGIALPVIQSLPYGSAIYMVGYAETSDLYAIKTYRGWDVYYEHADAFVRTYTDEEVAMYHAYQMIDLGVDHYLTKSVLLPEGIRRNGMTFVAAVRSRFREGEWYLMTDEGVICLNDPITTDDVRNLIQPDDDADTDGEMICVIRTVSGAEYRFSDDEFDNMPEDDEDTVEGTTLDGIFICIKKQYIESVAGIPA